MVRIQQLDFGYGREPLFHGLDLVLEPGNIYGLLGRNGAGKTTLLRLMSGLLFPGSGSVEVFGVEAGRRLPSMLSDLYLVPEEVSVPALTSSGYERIHAPFYPRFDRSRFREYLAEFEVRPERLLPQLSLGQKKKFVIAFALASGCRFLMMDEPTNGLDIPSKSQFRRVAASALQEDRTFLISTHQVRDMENIIDPIIILEEGRIILHESLERVARHLSFSIESGSADSEDPDILFAERSLGGTLVVRRNEGGEESPVDIEVLFNTVIRNRDRVLSLLAEGGSHEQE